MSLSEEVRVSVAEQKLTSEEFWFNWVPVSTLIVALAVAIFATISPDLDGMVIRHLGRNSDLGRIAVFVVPSFLIGAPLSLDSRAITGGVLVRMLDKKPA